MRLVRPDRLRGQDNTRRTCPRKQPPLPPTGHTTGQDNETDRWKQNRDQHVFPRTESVFDCLLHRVYSLPARLSLCQAESAPFPQEVAHNLSPDHAAPAGLIHRATPKPSCSTGVPARVKAAVLPSVCRRADIPRIRPVHIPTCPPLADLSDESDAAMSVSPTCLPAGRLSTGASCISANSREGQERRNVAA